MTILRNPLIRMLQSGAGLHTQAALRAVDKGQLAALRKATGFSMSNCKKALELNNNDLAQAEAWLQAEAQAQGWAKATKLAGRTTSQGLVGIHIDGHKAALVEINCETDFVARNDTFKSLVAQVARECAEAAQRTTQPLQKEMMSGEQLQSLTTNDGRRLGDLVALAIGSVGENMSLARGMTMVGGEGVQLVGYTHPATPDAQVLAGKFGALLALKTPGSLTEVARQLCVHVVGMNPKAVGDESDPKSADSDEEPLLVHQDFLSDPGRTVGEVLKEQGIQVLDFARFECGEQASKGV